MSERENLRDLEPCERPNYLMTGLIILSFVLLFLIFIFQCKGLKLQ